MRISKAPDVRKSELIEAAEQLFREDGYKKTSVNDIVKKVGVAQGTFYYYFESKDDIMDAVINHYFDNYSRALQLLLSDEQLDPCQKIEMIANTTLGLHKYDCKLVEFLHSEENLVTHQKYMLKSFETILPLITAIVEQGIEAGLFHVRYPQETVQMLLYAFGYLEESIALSPDDDLYFRKIGAAEDILVQVLGAEKGRLKLDPALAKDVPRLIHQHLPGEEA
jgi:AcrR family transcriptional regulator